MPSPGAPEPRLSRWAVAALAAAGVVLGVVLSQVIEARPALRTTSTLGAIDTVIVERKPFESALRTGGTVGAARSAMIRAPRMRGGRDRGGGGTLTIQSLAEPGSMVEKGELVAVFETRRTADMLDNYESALAQSRRRNASRKANMLASSESLRQAHRRAAAEAGKSQLDLRTAEVRSEIQAEILALVAKEREATSKQLEEEVRLSEIADAAETRSLDLDLQRDYLRFDRTKTDLDKMRIHSPVSGLVVAESTFKKDSFSQAAEGDQVHPGSYFLRIVDLSRMVVFADINQVDTQLVAIGSAVGVELDAYPGEVFEGRVASIGAVAVAGGSSGGGGKGMRGSKGGASADWVRKVPIEIEILSHDDRILPDLSASADIQLARRDDEMVVPRAAVGMSGGRAAVWVREGEAFVARPVEIGPLSDTEAVVLSGLTEGEIIAAQGLHDESMLVASKAD